MLVLVPYPKKRLYFVNSGQLHRVGAGGHRLISNPFLIKQAFQTPQDNAQVQLTFPQLIFGDAVVSETKLAKTRETTARTSKCDDFNLILIASPVQLVWFALLNEEFRLFAPTNDKIQHTLQKSIKKQILP